MARATDSVVCTAVCQWYPSREPAAKLGDQGRQRPQRGYRCRRHPRCRHHCRRRLPYARSDSKHPASSAAFMIASTIASASSASRARSPASRPKSSQEDFPRRLDVATSAVVSPAALPTSDEPTAHASRPEGSHDDSPRRPDVAAAALKNNKNIGPATALPTSNDSNVMPQGPTAAERTSLLAR